MLHNDPTKRNSLGADLRALRKNRGLTLAELADHLGRSVGWLSQVEREQSEPSIDDLKGIASALGVSLSMLFGQAEATANEVGYIVRQGVRRAIGSRAAGIVEELLSPDLTDDFEMVHSVFEPGSSLQGMNVRPTQEVAYMVSGKLDLVIGSSAFTVGPGDSFRIRGDPHSWANPYHEPAIAIWVIAPPVY